MNEVIIELCKQLTYFEGVPTGALAEAAGQRVLDVNGMLPAAQAASLAPFVWCRIVDQNNESLTNNSQVARLFAAFRRVGGGGEGPPILDMAAAFTSLIDQADLAALPLFGVLSGYMHTAPGYNLPNAKVMADFIVNGRRAAGRTRPPRIRTEAEGGTPLGAILLEEAKLILRLTM